MVNGDLPIYFINLASRPDRLAFMIDQFAALGLSAVRIEATRPDDLPESFVERYGNPRRVRFLSPQQLSCTVSHTFAWKELLRSGADRALILEDDTVLSAALPAFLRELPPLEFDLIRIEAATRPLLSTACIPGISVAGVSLRRFRSTGWGSAGYIVTANAAQRLIKSPNLFDRPTDSVLFCPIELPASEYRLAQTDPALCIQLKELQQPVGEDLRRSDIRVFLRAKSAKARASRLARRLRWTVIKGRDMLTRRDLKRRKIPFHRGNLTPERSPYQNSET